MSRLISIVVLVVGMLSVPLAVTAAPPSPFTGSWTSVDVDGSNQRLTIGGGPAPRVLLRDDGATVCGLDDEGEPEFAARASGRAAIAGTTLTVDFDLYCLASPTYFLDTFPGITYDYDAGTDTLTDNIGVVWSRAGS